MNAKDNTQEELRTIWHFTDEFLVVCPRCQHQAMVKPSTETVPPRLTCTNCGLLQEWASTSKGVLTSGSAQDWPAGQYAIGDSYDPYFHLPLWLQAACDGHVLWAFNQRHLRFIRDYVAATNRSTPPRHATDPLNGLLESRLPRWIKLAKNREAVLRSIEIIEEKLNID